MAFGMPDGAEGDAEVRPMAEMNVTPLVDVMLVLLIIFMVAAPMMMAGVPVDLPRSGAPRAATQRPPIVLTVTRDGGIFIAREKVAESELADKLRSMVAADSEAPVYVRGDRAAPYGEVLRIMGRITQAGIPRVSLIAEADPAAPAQQAR